MYTQEICTRRVRKDGRNMDKIMELLNKVIEVLKGLLAKLGLGNILDSLTGLF